MNTPDNMQGLQLALEVLNVLVLPALLAVGRWLVRVELRLARIEWAAGDKPAEAKR